MRSRVLSTQDLYLHISVGQWILAHHSVPDHGIFSASMPHAPWVAHEWLSAVASALLYDHFGWGGILACVALLIGLAICLLAADVARTLGPLGALCCAILGWGLCVHHLVARPHVATMPLLVIWIAAHVRARHDDRVPPLYLTPLMTLWANLHGGFMFGLVFTALFAAEAVFESHTAERARRRDLLERFFRRQPCGGDDHAARSPRASVSFSDARDGSSDLEHARMGAFEPGK